MGLSSYPKMSGIRLECNSCLKKSKDTLFNKNVAVSKCKMHQGPDTMEKSIWCLILSFGHQTYFFAIKCLFYPISPDFDPQFGLGDPRKVPNVCRVLQMNITTWPEETIHFSLGSQLRSSFLMILHFNIFNTFYLIS